VAGDVEHFFMYLLAICTFSFETTLFSLFAHLFSGLWILCGARFLNSFYILVVNPLSDVQLVNIFSNCVGCVFSLGTVFPM
jgi:hypothetical protein